MKYFKPPFKKETINKEYKILCKKLHPDKGGNETEFKEMKTERDNLIKALQNYSPPIKKQTRPAAKKTIPKKIIINIDGNKLIEMFIKKLLK
ncbi:MAG: hypothetical protein WCH21_02270 [Bacteroidota bacterium]